MASYRSSLVVWACFSLSLMLGFQCNGLAAEADGVTRHPGWKNALKPSGERGAAITLADNGESRYQIVCASDATTQDVKAARDLAHWLQEMTQAQLLLLQEDPDREDGYVLLDDDSQVYAGAKPDRFISIGRTRLFAQAEIESNELDLGNEGYAIAQHGENLYLVGGKTRGIINSVYALLEEDLGCRWYTPQATSIPSMPTLTFHPVSRSYSPVLADRREPHYSHVRNEHWALRNRIMPIDTQVPMEYGGYVKKAMNGFHTFSRLISRSEFSQYPEYFMMRDGKRDPHQLCLTNPQVRKIIIEKTLENLEKNPDARIVEISPNDGGLTCACDSCKPISDAEGSNMGPLLDLTNAVADAVAEDYPEVRVATMAYLDTKLPPKTMRPRDNVVIWLATDDHNWEYLLSYVWETEDFSKALKAWQATGATVVIWDYPIDYHRYAQPLANMPVVTENMRYYAQHGATGIFLQAQHNPTHGVDRAEMRSWVWGKQLWDLSLDTKSLVRDFNHGYYGKAAEPMQKYDDMMWGIWEKLHANPKRLLNHYHAAPIPRPQDWGPGAGNLYLTNGFVVKAMGLFDEAMELAAGDPVLTRRIEFAKLPIYYLMAQRGPGSNVQAYLEMLDDYERIASRHGHITVTYVQSGLRNPQLSELLKQWRSDAESVLK